MEVTVYNPQKGRLETVDLEFTAENTTWFERNTKTGSIASITDYKVGIVIKTLDHNYPVWVYEVTRADIRYCKKKAQALVKQQVKGD
jgi:hypothetical protein